MLYGTRAWVALLLLSSPVVAFAQADPGQGAATPQAATAPTVAATARPAEPASPPPWYKAVTFSGSVDAYYQLRLDAAQDAALQQRAFDAPTGFTLGQALLSSALAPAPAGFRVDLDFGNTASVVDAVSAAAAGTGTPTIGYHVLQAYAALKLGPAQLDVGRFVTSAGAEVVPAKDDWLYSRSLLFNLIPITHTGARVTVPVTSTLTAQAAVVNGWDTVSTSYAGKTGEMQLAYAGPSSTTVALTSYVGPNPTLWSGAPNAAHDWRTLVDLVAGTALNQLALNLNLDWGNESGDNWYGASLMARYSLPGNHLRITGRGEYVRDDSGVRFGTGTGTDVWEATAGLSAPVASSAELRLEFRLDKASQNIFTPGKDTQATATLAALAWF